MLFKPMPLGRCAEPFDDPGCGCEKPECLQQLLGI
jgi:hypothetical protein